MSTIDSSTGVTIARRLFDTSRQAVSDSLIRMATGVRINSGRDDPAGLVTAGNLRSVLAGLDAELRSLERTHHVAETAEGGLGEISGLLGEAQALVVANANEAGLSEEERLANQVELDSILASVDRIAGATTFNGDRLLDGTATLTAGEQSLAIDEVSTSQLGEISIAGEAFSLSDLGSGGSLNIIDGDLDGAQVALDTAVGEVSTLRGRIGSFQKDVIGSSLTSVASEFQSTSAATSRLLDTDFAAETAALARNGALAEAALFALGVSVEQTGRAVAFLG